MYEKYIKRLLDIILSGLFIAFFFWVYLILALAIKIDDPAILRSPLSPAVSASALPPSPPVAWARRK